VDQLDRHPKIADGIIRWVTDPSGQRQTKGTKTLTAKAYKVLSALFDGAVAPDRPEQCRLNRE